jgi:hypothetical protein
MNAKPKYTVSDAADMAREFARQKGCTWEWAIAQAAHVTKISRGAIESRIDRDYNDWCAQYGYDYT